MNAAAIARIRASYEAIAPRADAVVACFYEKLFSDNPAVRAIFPPDMSRQRQHLAAALAIICRNVDRLDILEDPLMQLGAQHVGYGTKPEHYPAVRDALLFALSEGLGDRWTPQLQEDWQAALNAVMAAMLKGHAQAVMDVARTLTPHAPPPHTPPPQAGHHPPGPSGRTFHTGT